MQGEANVTALRIEFDEGWDSFAKTVTFWNARGENPVKRILTADLLEDITKSTRIYLCPIPGEPLELAGECTFVIDGAADGKRPRSLPAELKVRPAPYADNAGEPVDPTPTQAEQLQGQIDTLLGDMQEQAVIATYAAEAAEESAENAKKSEDSARKSAEEAAEAVFAKEAIENMVVTGENVPPDSDTPVVEKTFTNEGYVHLHINARQGVSGVYVGSGEMPEDYNVQVDWENGSEVVDFYALTAAAERSANEATASKESAEASELAAESAEASAKASERAAASSAEAAKSAQAAAEKARDEAQQAAGGEFADKIHAHQHSADGSDPITPAMIGAVSRAEWEANLLASATVE